jgi:hypothetical protein
MDWIRLVFSALPEVSPRTILNLGITPRKGEESLVYGI